MSTPDDDDALSWGGDDDPTLTTGARPSASTVAPSSASTASDPALPDGFTAVGKGSERVGHLEADGTVVPAHAPAPMSNTMLITIGVLAGVYLLFSLGWVIGGLRLRDVSMFLVSPVAYLPAFVLALAAPTIWFATTILLTRTSKTWVRLAWLVAGALLMIPWPFVMIGAFGQ